ncbi:MAG: tetratricopeptide repeat protein [Balneolaceae bacterium]
MIRIPRIPTPVLILLSLLPFSAGAQHVQESPDANYQTGSQLYSEGLFSESIPHFERAFESAGENAAVREAAAYHIVRARSRVRPSDFEREVEWFVRAFPNSRHSSAFLIDLAIEYTERELWADALELFERARLYPIRESREVELLYQMAESAVEGGYYSRARSYFLELADGWPDSGWAPLALYSRGRLYIEEENYESSSTAFELLRMRYPNHAITRRIGTALAESYYQQDRFEEAAAAFEEAIPYLDGEERSKAIYLTGESYNALNQLDEAARFYRLYLSRAGDDQDTRAAYYGLGWVFHKQGIYHWAAEAFNNASGGDDEIARKALYYKAVNEKIGGRYQSSLETFREFGDRFQEGLIVEEAWYEWAVTAFERGRYVEAIEVLLPLARRTGELQEPARILTFLGEAYYANGEYTLALEAFDVVEELGDVDPRFRRQARFQRAWLRYSNQAYEQAQPEFQAVYDDAPNSDLGAEALFWGADSHYQLANYGPAATQFVRFIEDYPGHELAGAARYALGWSYFMMGDFENAVGPFVDFLENYEPPSIALFPYETDTQLRIGDSWFALGEYGRAMEYYNRVIGAEPGGDYAMFQVANSYYRMNRNFEAVTEFRRLLRIYPYSSLREQAQYNVAYIYLNTGNYEQAVEEFRTIIERFPGTSWAARAQYNIGDAWYNAGEYTSAIEAYNEVLRRYPGSDYVIEAIGGIQYAQLSAGEEDRSIDILEEFLANNPASGTADRLRYRQAEAIYQMGNYEGAVEDFQQYIRITNSDDMLPDAWYNLADAYLRTGRTEQAIESFATVAEEYAESGRAADALARLGSIHQELGEYEEASRFYSYLLEQPSRHHSQAWLGMGEASLSLSRLDEATTRFENALRLSPGNAVARLGLAKIQFSEGRHEEARNVFREIADESSTEIGAEAQFMLGRSLQAEQRFEDALAAYARLTVLFDTFDNWIVEAHYNSSEIYIRQGNRTEAISTLNYIIDNYPGSEVAARARTLLGTN